VHHAQEEYEAARVLFAESLAIRQALGKQREAAKDLEWLAAVATAQGQSLRAARLLGAAESMREASRALLPPARRTEYEREVAAVRAALGEEAFAAAWAEGRAMSPEQAVQYALDERADD
jgi:hypothetical protein